MQKIDLTCVITGHREGRLSVPSLRSFNAAMEAAVAAGYKCEALYVLDTPDELTERLFRDYCNVGEVMVVDFADQGKSRNAAVNRAQGHYCAFLDGDDLWSSSWLIEALEYLADKPPTHIAHPEFNYFFEGQATIFCHIDQESDAFRYDLLRVANYWDSLCVCPTEIYREFPFYTRDISGGWAYEDWYWNCETVEAGKVHKIVPSTVLFKRRQEASQTIEASRNKSMIRLNALSRYDNARYDLSESKSNKA